MTEYHSSWCPHTLHVLDMYPKGRRPVLQLKIFLLSLMVILMTASAVLMNISMRKTIRENRGSAGIETFKYRVYVNLCYIQHFSRITHFDTNLHFKELWYSNKHSLYQFLCIIWDCVLSAYPLLYSYDCENICPSYNCHHQFGNGVCVDGVLFSISENFYFFTKNSSEVENGR